MTDAPINFTGDPAEFLFSLLQDVNALVWDADADTWTIEFINTRVRDMLGHDPWDVVATPGFWAEKIVHPDDLQLVIDARQRLEDTGLYDVTYRGRHLDGRIVWLRETARLVIDEIERRRLRGTSIDVTELLETRDRFRVLTEESSDVIVITRGRQVIDVNPAFTKQLHYTLEDAQRLGWDGLLADGSYAQIAGAGEADVPTPIELELTTQSGYVRLFRTASRTINYQGAPALIVVMTDITDQRARETAALRAAETDHLTALLNRAALERDLGQACLESERGAGIGVVFLDLNGFKAVNDTHGHEAGDAVLCEVARRLSATVRSHERCYRLAGDEFVAVVRTPSPEQGLTATDALGARIRVAFAEPLMWQGVELPLRAAIGTAVCPTDAATGPHLLAHADQAMYRDKRGRRTAGGGGSAGGPVAAR
jgi:diguanylate cyclase (GGDEF)-like protein/PAS domain S-box-containing protein